jgi:hypothetical protein
MDNISGHRVAKQLHAPAPQEGLISSSEPINVHHAEPRVGMCHRLARNWLPKSLDLTPCTHGGPKSAELALDIALAPIKRTPTHQSLHGGEYPGGGELSEVEGLGGDEMVHDVRGAEVEAEELKGPEDRVIEDLRLEAHVVLGNVAVVVAAGRSWQVDR